MACGQGCSDAEAAARFLAAEHERDGRGQQGGHGPDPGGGNDAPGAASGRPRPAGRRRRGR